MLSEASRQTLIWQGGPMNEAETAAFREQPYFHDIIQVRIWDEEAKDPDVALLPIGYFRGLIHQHVSNHSNYLGKSVQFIRG